MTSAIPTSGGGRPDRADRALLRLPAGAVELAAGRLARAAATVDRLWAPSTPALDAGAEAAAHHLVAPLRLDPTWPDPVDPLPAPGGGAVHADLSDDDHDTLARLREVLTAGDDPATVDAERLAAAAQEWRLAVTPYRQRAGTALPYPGPTGAAPAVPGPAGPERVAARPQSPRSRPTADGFLVLDLTALWAGPLATALLAGLGVRVVKLDPSARPDALAERPAVFRHLNGAKERLDLDLRLDHHRRSFEALVARADLVIDSFSRRVMPNFGYGPADLAALAGERGNPGLATLSIVAFPDGTPEAEWIAYGPGVHAAVGLGARPTPAPARPDVSSGGRWWAAPVAYPDPLAGLTALAVAVEVLADPERLAGRPGGHHEVSLAGAVAPLVPEAEPVAVR